MSDIESIPGSVNLDNVVGAVCSVLQAAEASPENHPPTSSSFNEWFDYIAPDFVQSNVRTIAGAKKLIAAKKALKGSKGSFRNLVAELGMDLDKAERLMIIARHPVLSDSAHARILPLSWMTQFTLTKIRPEILAQLIADETVHPGLERKEAERLVQKVRGSNSNGTHDRDNAGNHGATTDLVEIVRSAIRDGLRPERLDLFYRPEIH